MSSPGGIYLFQFYSSVIMVFCENVNKFIKINFNTSKNAQDRQVTSRLFSAFGAFGVAYQIVGVARAPSFPAITPLHIICKL